MYESLDDNTYRVNRNYFRNDKTFVFYFYKIAYRLVCIITVRTADRFICIFLEGKCATGITKFNR